MKMAISMAKAQCNKKQNRYVSKNETKLKLFFPRLINSREFFLYARISLIGYKNVLVIKCLYRAGHIYKTMINITKSHSQNRLYKDYVEQVF